MSKFSVLISVYKNEQPAFFRIALDSLLKQTMPPSEIVLVKDGPLTRELESVIAEFSTRVPNLHVFPLQQNHGLGYALRYGLEKCQYELVARMDSDDISAPDRFALQIRYMEKHPVVAVCGGHIEEFMTEPGDLSKIKKVPLSASAVRSFARLRNPVNHPTAMLRKSAVIAAGSYMEMPLFEDYYLWLRMLNKGFIIENIDETLLYFRIGNMLSRRHGQSYFKKERFFFATLLEERYINFFRYFVMLATRLPFRILPARILSSVYKVFLRENGFISRRLK